jgi:hypothetical protein
MLFLCRKFSQEQAFSEFVNRLGPGQSVGRQVLGSPCLGEVQMSLLVEKGQLVVEIIRAKHLKPKAGFKVLPGIFQKKF